MVCTEELSSQAGLWQGPGFPSGKGFTSVRKHLVIMTTNCVNQQLELKVTDKLLWDSCGYARERSQNEHFWENYMCQWGIILFLCWLLMHRTEIGLCQNRAGPLLGFMRHGERLGGSWFCLGRGVMRGATGTSLLDSCPKQGKAGSCLLLPEWLLRGPGRLGLQDHASWGTPPSALSRDLCEAEAAY